MSDTPRTDTYLRGSRERECQDERNATNGACGACSICCEEARSEYLPERAVREKAERELTTAQQAVIKAIPFPGLAQSTADALAYHLETAGYTGITPSAEAKWLRARAREYEVFQTAIRALAAKEPKL